MANQSEVYQPNINGHRMAAFDQLPAWARELCRKYLISERDYSILVLMGEEAAKAQCKRFYGDVI